MRSAPRSSLSVVLAIAGGLLAAPTASAGQLDSATYFALQRGMSESELLVRAGPPDLVTHPGGEVIVRRAAAAVTNPDGRLALIGEHERVRQVEIKLYHYVPDHREHDPHLTVVTLRGGRISEIERTKLLTRPSPPAGAEPEPATVRPRVTDADMRLERVERVLSAAEAYAATRARLKQQAAKEAELPAPADAAQTIIRDTTPEGVPYFGDQPPAE